MRRGAAKIYVCQDEKKASFGLSASLSNFDCWKRRHGIREIVIFGEKLSVDSSEVKCVQMKFSEIITKENVSPERIRLFSRG